MKWVVGIDEAGRGPLAGPVVVATVTMLQNDYKKIRWQRYDFELNDSKKISVQARIYWANIAKKWQKQGLIKYEISKKTAKQIDSIGISQCIYDCISASLSKLEIVPEQTQILMDGGLRAPTIYKNQKALIKGDQKEKIISLASVIAKVYRDAYMINQARKYKSYFWEENKGYGTRNHQKAIINKGISPLHRKTFLRRIIDK